MATPLLHNQRLEVLAMASLLDSDVELVRLELEAGLHESHFYTEDSLTTFRRIKNLRRQNRSPSWAMIVADLAIPAENRKRMSALSHNIRLFATQEEAREAFTTLDNLRKLRGMYDMAKSISETLNDDNPIDVDAEIQKTAKTFETIQNGQETSPHDDKATDARVVNIIDNLRMGDKRNFILTGMSEFDKASGGVERGTNVTVGSESGGGKSHLALCLGLNMARNGQRVVFGSLEMPYKMVWTRALSYLTGISYTSLLLRQISVQQYDWVKDTYYTFQESLRRTGGCFRIIAEQTFTSASFLAGIAPYKYDVIVVDYLSLFEGMRGQDFWMRIGESAADFQSYAIRNAAVTITVCQTDEDGKARLSAQIKDNAGLMWTWTANKKDKDEDNEKPVKGKRVTKQGGLEDIDFIDVDMPKGRTIRRFNMRLYRSTAHSQLSCDASELQKPWIYKFTQARDIYKQRPWEKGLDAGDAAQRDADIKRKLRRDNYRKMRRCGNIIIANLKPLDPNKVYRFIERKAALRALRSELPDKSHTFYYHDDNPLPPSYHK